MTDSIANDVTDYAGDRLTRLVRIWVDAGYQGEGFMKLVMDTYRWILEVVVVQLMRRALSFYPNVGLSFAKRAEGIRNFGWFNWCRRLSKDYEILPETHEAFVQVAMIRLMLRRLA